MVHRTITLAQLSYAGVQSFVHSDFQAFEGISQ